MSVRAYKTTIVVLLCVSMILASKCWGLLGQLVWADFIEKQCKIMQDFVNHPPDGFDANGLAHHLDFFTGYCDAHSKSLVGSRIEWIVKRDYEQTLTNTLVLFRSLTTNDLGGDPQVWIKKYEHDH